MAEAKPPDYAARPVCELITSSSTTGTQVISIGNGPRGDEIIYVKRKEGPSPSPEPRALTQPSP